MTLTIALITLSVLLVATVLAALLLSRAQRRPLRFGGDEVIQPQRLGAPSLGERATILQFSTESCGRCPGVHRTLADVAGTAEGVVHLDVDLTHRPDIARHFHVKQTPTTLILDRNGVVQTRFGGAPGRDVVALEVARVTAGAQPV